MKRPVIQSFCDAHKLSQDSFLLVDPDGENIPLLINGRKALVDLCPTDRIRLLNPLLEFIRGAEPAESPVILGEPTAQPEEPPKPRGWTCPLCTKHMVYPNSACPHVIDKHLGGQAPPSPTSCPQCEYVGPARSVSGHRSINQHGSRLEDLISLARARADANVAA